MHGGPLRVRGRRTTGRSTAIDLEIEPGTVTGLVGANDAGKSTLCLVAAGVAPADDRRQARGNASRSTTSRRSKARPSELAQRCGVLFQNPSTQLSGICPDGLGGGRVRAAQPLAAARRGVERVDAALGALGITDLQERDPQRLSGGQAQLVALASVLALRPRYLVLDEPTSQLDPEGTRLVGDALAQAARATGAGILVAEHKTDLLARSCGSVVVLASGKVVMRGDPQRPSSRIRASASSASRRRRRSGSAARSEPGARRLPATGVAA